MPGNWLFIHPWNKDLMCQMQDLAAFELHWRVLRLKVLFVSLCLQLNSLQDGRDRFWTGSGQPALQKWRVHTCTVALGAVSTAVIWTCVCTSVFLLKNSPLVANTVATGCWQQHFKELRKRVYTCTESMSVWCHRHSDRHDCFLVENSLLTWMTANWKLPLVRNRTGKQWEMKRGILFKTGAMSILLARRLAQLWWDCSVSDLGVSLARPPSKANCSNGIKWKPILVWTGSWCAINTFVMFEHLENIICTTVCRTPRDWRAKVNITVSASIIELKKRQFFGWSMATAAVRSTSCLLGRWDNSCHLVPITCS